IPVAAGVNRSIEKYVTLLVRRVSSPQADERPSAPSSGDATQQRICAHAQFARARVLLCFYRVLALHLLERSRRDASGEALFVEVWFAVLGSTAIFAHGADPRDLRAPL